MSAPFYMPFYIDSYLGSTQARGLTTEQHGAYLLILFRMWTAGGYLPADPQKLARMAGLTPAKWGKIAPEVMSFFDMENGQISQARLLREYQRAAEISAKRSASGIAGSIAKSLKSKSVGQANGKPSLNSTSNSIRKNESSKELSCPNGFDAFWNSYPRKASKLASSKAYAKAIARIGGDDPDAFLLAALSVAKHGWTDERYTPHASSWLNGERYHDIPPLNIVSDTHDQSPSRTRREANLSASLGAFEEVANLKRFVA
jgi:uncharacterized protein YdaU (DUF1376 family)